MFTFKIIKAPKKNASVEEWCQFAATAPREMVVKVYRQLSRSAVNGRVLPLLEERIFSFDKRFAIYTKDVFANYMQVPAGISNRQIKERVEKCQKFPLLIVERCQKFPLLMVERCGGFPSSGWFRGMAITKDLILAGVIAEADMAFKYAEQVVEMNDFRLLTDSDVVFLQKQMADISRLFNTIGCPVLPGAYWLEGYFGDEKLVWKMGDFSKFGSMPLAGGRAKLIVKL